MKKFLLFAVLIGIGFSSCKQRQDKDVIGKPIIEIKDGKLTPEVLWSFGRIGDVSVSPSGEKVLYTVKYFDIKLNKGNSEIYSMNIDGSDVKQLTKTEGSEWNAVWSPDGKKIGFCYADDSGVQIYEMNTEGKARIKISNVKEGDIEGFSYSPNGKKILYIRAIAKKDKYNYLKEGLDKTTGRINDDLAYRHWDNWVDNIPQPFVADFDGKKLSNDINLLENTEFESPMRPWGGMEQLAWSYDSKQIVYTCRKKVGKQYALSTNSDIYLYDLDSKKTTNLSEGMMGYDQNPVFSYDGSLIAWESMERDGYEADKIRLMVMNLKTKEIKDYSKDFDQNANGLKFTKDNKSIYFISDYQGKDDIYQLTLSDNNIKKITTGIHDYTSVMIAKDKLIGTKMSMSQPIEIYAVNSENGQETNISNVNKDLLAKLKMGKIEERWFKATDGKDLHSWIIFPPDFDSTKKYPTILYCEGGPQSTVSQFWSYRWNFQIMASHGYIIVAPNRRGLPGFGQEWNEQISGDYGGQCMKDYLTAIDKMCEEPYVDKDNLGSVGASFGGFSVYWLAGHHEKRFKCFIAHNGMFNLEQQYLETEEMWFVNWDLGGPYWDKNNKTAQKSFANSPHKFVDKWDTPLLVIHSEYDYRIVASQGMAAYNAAVIRGIPSRYLYFPDESHWVLKPQNGILWQRNFFDWLDTWLKPQTEKKV
ncbi:MAG: S9 family peptidase [Bacteroidales bacterium]|nr:S9 family peptidase [Bacteroidales bacterium]MDD4002190.1 S9 family peptidase [Bacteroidales bacterium]